MLIHDEELDFNIDGIERHAPIRMWQKSETLDSKSEEESSSEHEKFEKVKDPKRIKIVLALHGLFDHKGAFHELASTLIEESPSTHPLMVIAADWPTYGTSEDRGDPMPAYPMLQKYLMTLLDHLSDRFTDGDFYLLGESLGGSMILMTSRELQEFQNEKGCIGGAVVISPAIHNPATNLYFQRRPLQMSAEPHVFRQIWFNDPEVNHQNAFSRVRATIPYLSEAYNSAMQWPENIPCAFFVASKDSVVTKLPILSLYNNLEDRENVAFYAFPSRHLILRSRSEEGKYIERSLIYKDIFSLLPVMKANQFNKETVLSFSGATSEETMTWYGAVYRSWCKCCGRISGYLSSWPITPPKNTPLVLTYSTKDESSSE